jgi:hypothetical protein
MRPIVLAAALVLGMMGCAEEEQVYPDPRGLYVVTGTEVACPSAVAVEEIPVDAPTVLVCTWTCLAVDSKDVREVTLEFHRETPAQPWGAPFAMWSFGVCE